MTDLKTTRHGVIPAEPGWRVALRKGNEVLLAPVVGWWWQERHFDDGVEEPSLGGAMVVDEGMLVSAQDAASNRGNGWSVECAVAPGKRYGAGSADGWESFALDVDPYTLTKK